MKKLASLVLLTATSAFAGDSCCSCESCCVPKPKQCIDCECYTPAYYDLQCDWGFAIDIEFLYWYGKETKLPVGSKVEITLPFIFLTPCVRENITMDAKWKPGFRVGLGLNSSCDGWDLFANWTYYHNKNSRKLSVPEFFNASVQEGDQVLFSPFIFNKTFPDTPIYSECISSDWRLNYNFIDLELGRKYWLSPCFSLRPFLGLRGGWTKVNYKTSIQSPLNGPAEDIVFFVDELKYKNRFWGIGFLGGLQPSFYFSKCFSLFGSVDFALLWGEYKENHDAFSELINRDAIPPRTDLFFLCKDSKEIFYSMQGIFDLAIGLRYEDTFCCDRYRIAFDLGWEHHLLYNHVNRFFQETILNVPPELPPNFGLEAIDEMQTDLVLGGFVARLRFDF